MLARKILRFVKYIAIFLYIMDKPKKAKTKPDGNQVMIPRLVYMEPELWKLLQRRGRAQNRTRSTETRITIKNALRPLCKNIKQIEWGEK